MGWAATTIPFDSKVEWDGGCVQETKKNMIINTGMIFRWFLFTIHSCLKVA